MESVRYEIDPRCRWIFSELARVIIEDFKNPETEAAYQKWKAQRDLENQKKQENLTGDENNV